MISALQWPSRTCNVPTRPYRVGKKLSVKADLAIYSHAVNVARQCMSKSLMLGHNLDFATCDVLVGFCKSSHIYRMCLSLTDTSYVCMIFYLNMCNLCRYCMPGFHTQSYMCIYIHKLCFCMYIAVVYVRI